MGKGKYYLFYLGFFALSCNACFAAVTDGIVPDGSTITNVPLNDITQNIDIDIADPNFAGTSWNNYTHFNIPAPGVTLDNNPATNPNLSASARVIINNVTSANTTTWLGELSVNGPEAFVLLSNPNGIFINGGSAANISSLILTTGDVINRLNAGGIIDGFNIDTTQGLIEIGSNGFSGFFNSLNFLSKELKISGTVENTNTFPIAKVIAITGDSDIDTSKQAQPGFLAQDWIDNDEIPNAGSGGTPNSAIAINLDQLGGITSSQITMVITDQGAGANIDNGFISATSSFDISADGELLFNNESTIAAGETNIESLADNINIAASQFNIDNNLNLSAIDLNIEDGSEINVLGFLEGGLQGDVNLDASTLNIGLSSLITASNVNSTGAAQWQADDLIFDLARDLINTDSSLTGLSSIDIDANNLFNQSTGGPNQGIIFAANNGATIDIDAIVDIDNHAGRIISNGGLDLDAGNNIRNYVTLSTGTTEPIQEQSSYRVTESFLGIFTFHRKVRSIRTIFPNLESLDEIPFLVSNGNMNINANNEFENKGGEVIVNGGGDLSVIANAITNQTITTGSYTYGKDCYFGCRTFGNSDLAHHGGNITVAGDALLDSQQTIINDGGFIQSVGDMTLNGPGVANSAVTSYTTYNKHRGLKFWEPRGQGLYATTRGGEIHTLGTLSGTALPITNIIHINNPPMEDQIGLFEDFFDWIGIDF